MMSDFLRRLTEEDAPVEREVTFDGQTGTVYFRRLSAGEQEHMLQAMNVKLKDGSGGPVDINLGENEKQRQLLVMYSVCDASGKRHFRDLKSVQAVPYDKLKLLSEHAAVVNRDRDEDLGKD
jgi:hypothetical protein